MNNSPHISLENLADIAEERDLSETSETLESAERHLAVCATCDASLQNLRRLVMLMKSDTAKDVPRDVLMSALRIFTPARVTPLRRIVAILSFDSRAAGPAFGMRSIYTPSRQLLYTAQETAVDLRVTVENGECHLAGQVIRDNCEGAQIELSGATGTVNTELNELCEFTFPAIPAGNYSLRVRMPDVEIEIPELELKD
jgi:hypothetical protein